MNQKCKFNLVKDIIISVLDNVWSKKEPLREHVQFIHCYAPPLDSHFSFLLLAISQPEILVLRSIKWKFNCWNKIYFLALRPQSRARPRHRTLGAKLACSWVQFPHDYFGFKLFIWAFLLLSLTQIDVSTQVKPLPAQTLIFLGFFFH